MTRRRRWAHATLAWSLVFAAPHLYWMAGGRWGLAGQASAADEALSQPWFYAYNLLAAVLALVGAGVALWIARDATSARVRRVLRAVARAASLLLLARGAIGVTLLAADLARGVMDSPLILVAVEPWFVLGGVLFGMVAARATEREATTGRRRSREGR